MTGTQAELHRQPGHAPAVCIRGSLQIDRAPEHDSRHHQQFGGPGIAAARNYSRILFSRLKSKARASPLRASQLFSTGLAYFAIRILMRPLNAHWVILKVQRLLVGLGNDAHGRELIPDIGSVPHARAYPLGKLLQLGSH